MAADTQKGGAAMRGRIVQRVLVDGWNAAQAAAVFEVRERDVVRWVAAYRRYGMASLRDDAAMQRAPRRWLRWLLLALRRMAAERGEGHAAAELSPIVLSRDRRARHSRR